MPALKDYAQFDGLHWETGSIRNALDYQGVKAPHTGKPLTEALLLGISGGVAMGYFSFAYEGYDPHARILTRNTFDPMDRILERSGVVQEVLRTGNPKKAVQNLIDVLENGMPAIVWADMFSLPYNALPYDKGMWAMFPIVVYGYDEVADRVYIADRARVPLMITAEELAIARGRVKKDKYQIKTPFLPDSEKLVSAVQKGIWDCVKLYTEAPPRGPKANFGLDAYHTWAELLIKPGKRMSWEKEFPVGRKMYAGLASVFTDINLFGKDGYAERDVYAAFLDEASVLLDKPALKEAADCFRKSAAAWERLSQALLPDDVPLLKTTRELMLMRHRLFLERGGAALNEIRAIDSRLEALKIEAVRDFPLNEEETVAMREKLRLHILRIHDIEREAVVALQDAML